MRELFAPYGEDPGTKPKEVEPVLASLEREYRAARSFLREYAHQLLAAGQKWLGAPRAAMAKPVAVNCGGLHLRVSPHRIDSDGSVVTLHFVRTRPSGVAKRQFRVLRWMLKYLAESHPKYSFLGNITVLSTDRSESVSPYGRLPEDFFLVPIANALAAGDFQARPNRWDCPKCRHFLYCPA